MHFTSPCQSRKRRICYSKNDFVRLRMTDGRDEWATRARRFLKAELKRAEVTYEELARRLGEMGIEETKGSVTVKVNRGAFPAWFFFAAMKAIGVAQVKLEDV